MSSKQKPMHCYTGRDFKFIIGATKKRKMTEIPQKPSLYDKIGAREISKNA